jgi:predicted DNA-binding transcriptional regulator AlpA
MPRRVIASQAMTPDPPTIEDRNMQPLLTQRQCAEALALSERTLERFRVSGVGPKFVRMGKSVRYRLSDVEAWIASRVVGSTSEETA